MKKNFLRMLVVAFMLVYSAAASYAQRNSSIDEINRGWTGRPISGVQNGNILTLLTAFNKTWRTVPATELLAHPVTNTDDPDAYSIVVDRPNGYVSIQELGDDGEALSACVWKRTNGHKLFAVVYTRYRGVFPNTAIYLYDYDQSKGKLTPEQSELSRFKPSFGEAYGVDAVNVKLPQHGKDVVVSEYIMGWGLSITHTYVWDGMKPKLSKIEIPSYGMMENKYNNEYQFENKIRFTKYELRDFDEDNIPELWLSNENDEYQAIFSLANGKVRMLASTYYKTHFMFYPGVIGCAGGCGTGCFSATYTVLNNSLPLYSLTDMQSWDYQKDDMVSTYYKNEKQISSSEGTHLIESYGKPLDITPSMRRLRP
jgi:hypothetical protein